MTLAQLGEEAAADHLTDLGFEILVRNYRCKLGELDIVALEAGVLAFIEVKTRSRRHWGAPEEAVGWEKQQRVRRLARVYLQQEWRGATPDCRFDVVAVWGRPQALRVEVFRDAF